jgi:uncharacterized protein
MTFKGLSGKQAKELIPERTILLGYRGSVAHGTYVKQYGPNAHDDKDLLGVAIGPLESYIGISKWEHHIKEIKGEDGVVWDAVTYELRKYIGLMLRANPNVLSLLFLPEHLYVIRTKWGQKLIDNRDLFCSRRAYSSFVGYARGQLHRMTHSNGKDLGAKRRELVEKFHYDTKNASHLIRILRLGIEFLSTGTINVLREDAQELIEIKQGEWSLEKVQKTADELFSVAYDALIHSPLPPEPNREEAENLCVEILTDWIC